MADRTRLVDGTQITLYAQPLVNGGAVDLTHGDTIVTFPISAGAQTMTVAAPGWAGQRVVFQATTDGGGSVVVTVPSTVNALGFNTLTFGEAGDTIVLLGIGGTTPATTRWTVSSNDGVTLSLV